MSCCLSTTILWSALAALFAIAYVYVKHVYTYWERRGVKSRPSPMFPVGHFWDTFAQRLSIGKIIEKFYNESSEPIVGVYIGTKPILLLRDPEIVRRVLIADFQHFHDRGIYVNEKRDPLSAHLFSLSGQKWKKLRTRLTPTFTSGKLKAMFGTLVDCGAPLQNYIDRLVSNDETLDVREISASYATNVIASVAFGVDINCIDDPHADFRIYGRKAFEKSVFRGFVNLGRFVFPPMIKYLPIHVVAPDIDRFMTSLVKETLEYREKTGVVRKDFFQLLVQLRNTGKVQLDDQWQTEITADESGKTLTLEEIAAQAYIFFLAGFETSSTTLSFCLHEIAKNAKIQAKVHEEIDRVLAEHDGKITYQSVTDMKYLENCIDETLRKYPPLPSLNRECTMDYTIPGTDIVIEKGTTVLIPALALQRDERYYPNPNEFNPDRFSVENLSGTTFVDRPYVPFGEGPRICIGLRMGKMQTKTGLILMLQNHRYEVLPEDDDKEIEIDPRAFLLAPKNDMHLLVRPR